MAIYDCFQFFNEEHIVDLRLNIFNKFLKIFSKNRNLIDDGEVSMKSQIDGIYKSKKINF